jgi:hypothetical protein
MFLSVPIPGTQEAINRDDMTLWPHQNAEVPMEISISLIQFVIANVLEITAYLILKFPELRLIIMLVLAPALECARCWRLLRRFQCFNFLHLSPVA